MYRSAALREIQHQVDQSPEGGAARLKFHRVVPDKHRHVDHFEVQLLFVSNPINAQQFVSDTFPRSVSKTTVRIHFQEIAKLRKEILSPTIISSSLW